MRRSVVPQVASRSLWLAAAWTGVGAALVAAVIAIAAVAICWLPASAGAGSASSAIRAGILTFLAALHGGITVDGLGSDFVPLGLTLLVGLIAWRAGSGLADAAEQLHARATKPLVLAGLLQAGVFALVCGLAAWLVTLGTSHASTVGAVLAGFVLFAVSGGTAFIWSSPLADEVRILVPPWLPATLRAATAGLTAYLGAGAVLVAGSLVAHHGRVETLSGQLGGGWSGIPVLLLGVLAAPNAVIAGAAYLAGPGFALGVDNGVSLNARPHGTLPAFPVLGAVPSGPASSVVWLLAAATPIVAGLCLAQLAHRADGWQERLRVAGGAVVVAAFAGLLLAWQGGGAIGSGRLNAVGASPWQLALAFAAGLAVVGGAGLAALGALSWWRARGSVVGDDAAVAASPAALAVVASVATPNASDDTGTGTADTVDPSDTGYPNDTGDAGGELDQVS